MTTLKLTLTLILLAPLAIVLWGLYIPYLLVKWISNIPNEEYTPGHIYE